MRAIAQRQVSKGISVQPEVMAGMSSPAAVSDQAVAFEHYQSLVRRAVSVFGDEITASRWLSTPSADFGGEAPLKIAQRDGYSLKQFEPIFVRIEHGIYF